MSPEDEIRKRVKILKRFYMDVINFIVVNIVLTLVWVTFDKTGNFWPKYIMLVWGVALLFRAHRAGVFSLMFHRTPLFGNDWEEKKVRELMHRQKRDLLDSSKEKDKRKKK